jgi:murein DD-endopeptidase MepM/ murein hydrolase activator NlpD
MKRKIQQSRFLTLSDKSLGVYVLLQNLSLRPLSSNFFLIRLKLYNTVGKWYSFVDDFSSRKISAATFSQEESNPLSMLLRPWFEHQRVRGIIGINLIFALVIFGLIGSPTTAKSSLAFASFSSNSKSNSSEEADVSVVEAPKEAIITTEKRFQMPVILNSVSQGYHYYHPGVDLRAEFGSEIKAIAEGVVLDVYRSQYGYGQSILVDHIDGYSSLYAHVQRISVEPGSDVDQRTIIAEVGLTGSTTGPHLHLEIYQEGKPVNPRYFFDY